MKYALQVAVVAMTLFSISAALSLWLNQQKVETAATADKGEKTEKKAGKEPGHSPDKDKEKEPAKPGPKTDTQTPTPVPVPSVTPPSLDTRAAQLDRRQAMTELIQQDMQAHFKLLESLTKQVVQESKAAAAKAGEVEARAAELDKKRVELDASEAKNVERIAGMVDGMPPETAAQVLTQMADTGKLDTVVKVLASMKQQKAARVMAEMERELAGQLLDRMRGYKPVVPAGGPGRSP